MQGLPFVPLGRNLTSVTHATPFSHRPDELEVTRSRVTRFWWIPVALVAVLLLVWWMTHPSDLHTASGTEREGVKAGQTLYVGIDQGDDERTIHVRSVELTLDGPGKGAVEGVEIKPLVCDGGIPEFTRDAEQFCKLTKAKGADIDFADGEQLVLAVTGERAMEFTIEQVDVSYRTGIQWGTQPIGGSYEITILE